MRVAVLMGGASSEREVSLISGEAVTEALESIGHEVDPIDFDHLAIEQLMLTEPEVVFIALHGCPGEDGTVQGMLEVLGMPYTGSGVLGSALAIDKGLTKRFLQSQGLPTPRGIVHGPGFNPDAAMVSLGSMGIGFPIVIKPSKGGSTIGITIAKDRSGLIDGLREAMKYDSYALLEEFIEGPEITVSILDGRVLPSIEIVSETGFYDYEAKYTAGLSRHVVPPRVEPSLVKMAEEFVLSGFHLLQLSGMSRSEVIFDRDGRPNILEYNTIPGFTPLSLFPDAAKHAGIEFPRLCEMLCEIAIRDRRGKRI